MTWEEKLAALKALTPTHLEMRKPGDWYVSAYGREIQTYVSCTLLSDYGNGASPEEAVEDDWQRMTKLPPGGYIVLHATTDKRRHVVWNGYMWEDSHHRPAPKEKAPA